MGKIAQQYIVEIVFDNYEDGMPVIDTEAICEHIKESLELARITGQASLWRPKGVGMTEINVQYEGDCDVE